jgi:hypothetical protein
MAGLAFRLFFGERPATRAELETIEEIEVEQEMDMAWEARIRLSLCLDEKGRWKRRPQEFTEPFSRVRVELRVSDVFAPLIDGPVARYDTALDSRPGRSTVTLVVRDDSVLMNREEASEVFEGRSDDAIARAVFGRFPFIGDTRIEPTRGERAAVALRGTAIQYLRELAHAHGYHAYVLPGDRAGRSVGCFLPDPAEPGDLPRLVLMGSGRNVLELEVHEDAESPETSRARTLRLRDQQTVSAQTGVGDLTLVRPLPPLPGLVAAKRLVRPEENDREDPETRARASARRAAYAYRASGKLVPGCYPAALVPYQRVAVEVGDLPLSGEWLITKVTHRITPDVYVQEFEAKCDSRQDTAANAAPTAGGAGLPVDFSTSISVF